MSHEYLLAIPVFNEERTVDRVLDEVKRYSRHILVIDDGSTDGTPAILRRHPEIGVITHAENLGYGRSLADAFAFARRGGFRWLITMDCDEQHEPSCIPCFAAAMSDDDADIISGTRYPAGFDTDAGAPPDRRRINRQITTMLNRRLGLTLTDAFCGFKAYRVSSLRHFRITVPGYAMPIQLWVQAARAGLRIRELPVKLIYNDPTRHFGGHLDDPAVRLAHYREVLDRELSGFQEKGSEGDCGAWPAVKSASADPLTAPSPAAGESGGGMHAESRPTGKSVPHKMATSVPHEIATSVPHKIATLVPHPGGKPVPRSRDSAEQSTSNEPDSETCGVSRR